MKRKIYLCAFLLLTGLETSCRLRTLSQNTLRETNDINFPVTTEELTKAIAENRYKVKEFATIAEVAKGLGIRVWLFGGTAAGFGHYNKWDLQRQKGDKRYQPERFDYYYWSIFRSTQDADIVIDGTPEQAEEFERFINQKFEYLKGAKANWEVRLLKQDRGTKEALLNNPNFLNQHTDSNSVGMIELTDPPEKEGLIRDLRDWENQKEPYFLRDIRDGVLHFYYSDKHKETKRYKNHENPEIFSVIRYFTKAFQYELKIPEDSYQKLKMIVDQWDPKADHATWAAYAKAWVEERGNGAKIFKHAVDVEYAWNELQKIGLREKLMAISEPKTSKSLAWWMNKEPLRSFEVGQGDGRSIEELGITLVAHETVDFLTYESLTRNTKNAPNVFKSRANALDERALYGDGFYTKIGKEGATGSGFTIRYIPNPKAREKTDFIYVPEEKYIVFLNRKAFTVVYENLNMTWLEFLKLVSNKENAELIGDKGVFGKLKFRLNFSEMPPKERSEIDAFLKGLIDRGEWRVQVSANSFALNPALSEWYSRPNLSENDIVNLKSLIDLSIQTEAKTIQEFVQLYDYQVSAALLEVIVSNPTLFDRPDILMAFANINHEAINNVYSTSLSENGKKWIKYRDFVRKFIKDDRLAKWGIHFVYTNEWLSDQETLDLLANNRECALSIAIGLDSMPPGDPIRKKLASFLFNSEDPAIRARVFWVEIIEGRQTNRSSYSLAETRQILQLMDQPIKSFGGTYQSFLAFLVAHGEFHSFPVKLFTEANRDVVDYFLSRKDTTVANEMLSSLKGIQEHVLEEALNRGPASQFYGSFQRALAESLLIIPAAELTEQMSHLYRFISLQTFQSYPTLLSHLLSNRDSATRFLYTYNLQEMLVSNFPEVVKKLFEQPEILDIERALFLIERVEASKRAELIIKLLQFDEKYWHISYGRKPEPNQISIKQGYLVNLHFILEKLTGDPTLQALTGGPVNYESLKNALQSKRPACAEVYKQATSQNTQAGSPL